MRELTGWVYPGTPGNLAFLARSYGEDAIRWARYREPGMERVEAMQAGYYASCAAHWARKLIGEGEK